MLQEIIDKLYARFLGVVYSGRQKVLTEEEVKALADGRILTAGDALEARLIDQMSYLDETIDTMKKRSISRMLRLPTSAPRPSSRTYSGYPEMPLQGPQVINLISINAEDLALFSGVQFMYLWNP
jgi:protease-4